MLLRTRITGSVCRLGRHGGRDGRTDGHRRYSYSITLSLAGASAQWELFISCYLIEWRTYESKVRCDSENIT